MTPSPPARPRSRWGRWLTRLVHLQVQRPAWVLAVSTVLTALALVARAPARAAHRLRVPAPAGSTERPRAPSRREEDGRRIHAVRRPVRRYRRPRGRPPSAPAGRRRPHRCGSASSATRGWAASRTGSRTPTIPRAARRPLRRPRGALAAPRGPRRALRVRGQQGRRHPARRRRQAARDRRRDHQASASASSDLAADRYPDGYYQSSDGRVLVVAIRSQGARGPISAAAARRSGACARSSRRRTSTATRPPIRYGLSGDLYSGVAELTAVNEDLTKVGLTGLVLIGAIVFLYYLRLRALLTMLLTILVGVSWSFGFTELAIGSLNLATGFLFTIIAGNGINAGIIYMARYLEARRKGASLAVALHLAHEETWLATLTACAAAAAAYASLTLTEFRGFRDFGLIGARRACSSAGSRPTGPCPRSWSVLERVAPARARGPSEPLGRASATPGGRAFGAPFAWLVVASAACHHRRRARPRRRGGRRARPLRPGGPDGIRHEEPPQRPHARARTRRATSGTPTPSRATSEPRPWPSSSTASEQVAPLRAVLLRAARRRARGPAPVQGSPRARGLRPRSTRPRRSPSSSPSAQKLHEGPPARLHPGGGLGAASRITPPGRSRAVRDGGSARGRGARLHRDRRDARAHRLHQPDRPALDRGRALPPALGRRLPRDAPARTAASSSARGAR